MADEKDITKTADELSDIEVADLANKEIRKRDDEIASLKKQLAIAKLYSEADEGSDKEPMSLEDCIKTINNPRSYSYDIFNAVCEDCDRVTEQGGAHPLGPDGEQIVTFFRNVLDECDGDKSRFHSVYQSMIGPDEPSVALAYRKNKMR